MAGCLVYGSRRVSAIRRTCKRARAVPRTAYRAITFIESYDLALNAHRSRKVNCPCRSGAIFGFTAVCQVRLEFYIYAAWLYSSTHEPRRMQNRGNP